MSTSPVGQSWPQTFVTGMNVAPVKPQSAVPSLSSLPTLPPIPTVTQPTPLVQQLGSTIPSQPIVTTTQTPQSYLVFSEEEISMVSFVLFLLIFVGRKKSRN